MTFNGRSQKDAVQESRADASDRLSETNEDSGDRRGRSSAKGRPFVTDKKKSKRKLAPGSEATPSGTPPGSPSVRPSATRRRRRPPRRNIPGLAARAIAADCLSEILQRRRAMDAVLDARLATARLENNSDRALVSHLVRETLRRLGQLDDLINHCLERPFESRGDDTDRAMQALRLGALQLHFMDVPDHAAISTSVSLVAKHPHAPIKAMTGLVNAVLRRLSREGAKLIEQQDAALLNTPEWLWADWVRDYGEDNARAFAELHQQQPPLDLTVKPGEDREALAEALAGAPVGHQSIRLPGKGRVEALAGYGEGRWWVQDVAATYAVPLLGVKSGDRVLDVCAAPGGKTMQLAALGADVTALDQSWHRLERLKENMERTGLSADPIKDDARTWTPTRRFDHILIDLPCTATGTLRRHPDGAHIKSGGDVASILPIQKAILQNAARLVKAGGRCVLALCSLNKHEGEALVAWAKTACPELALDPLNGDEFPDVAVEIAAAGTARVLPTALAGKDGVYPGGNDGFFFARFIAQ
ncbi:MAG: transcription antitermination factor NusB [Pseudomonadota bacterium]